MSLVQCTCPLPRTMCPDCTEMCIPCGFARADEAALRSATSAALTKKTARTVVDAALLDEALGLLARLRSNGGIQTFDDARATDALLSRPDMAARLAASKDQKP